MGARLRDRTPQGTRLTEAGQVFLPRPSHVVLATRAGDRSRLVADFRRCAQAHLTGPAPAGSP